MPIRCVILDFDGTFTDVDREAAPFLVEFRRDLVDLIGRPEAEAAWEEASQEIVAHPTRHGWQFGGRIIAPAGADPYIRASCVAQLLFDRFGMLRGHEARTTVLQALYHKAYRSSATVFRPDAATTLARLLESGIPTFVVTNARPDAVKQKLRELLGEAPRIEVIGDAQKFALGPPSSPHPWFDRLPAERRLPGLPSRPIYLHRGKYFEALVRVFSQAGVEPAEALVVGDIFELDLALPAELGAAVHLLARPDTPEYERAAVASLAPRGAWSEQLAAALDRLAAP